mmetsp:Transcript_446/g.1250  ORF Transcript_446/g.1250 Transcript_446/m.1250 type:complete len:127 (+) Transcript_446:305-685(+)
MEWPKSTYLLFQNQKSTCFADQHRHILPFLVQAANKSGALICYGNPATHDKKRRNKAFASLRKWLNQGSTRIQIRMTKTIRMLFGSDSDSDFVSSNSTWMTTKDWKKKTEGRKSILRDEMVCLLRQ